MMVGWNRNHQPKEIETPLLIERRFLYGRYAAVPLLKLLTTCPKHVPEREGERHARIGPH